MIGSVTILSGILSYPVLGTTEAGAEVNRHHSDKLQSIPPGSGFFFPTFPASPPRLTMQIQGNMFQVHTWRRLS